jgi:DNA-binding transcriptional MerR regulator
MAYKEKEIEKLYYSIGEVAKMFEVNTSHIRFWSKEFDVIKPATNKKGNRMYTQSDIDNFKKIYHLVKEKGFTLKGAKIELRDHKTKMKLAGTPAVAYKETAPETFVEPELFEAPEKDDFVDKIALVNSLRKIRKSLVDIQGQLTQLEV